MSEPIATVARLAAAIPEDLTDNWSTRIGIAAAILVAYPQIARAMEPETVVVPDAKHVTPNRLEAGARARIMGDPRVHPDWKQMPSLVQYDRDIWTKVYEAMIADGV